VFEDLLGTRSIGSLYLTRVEGLHVMVCTSPVAQPVTRAVLLKAL
jgi:hypothetical protein